MIAKLLEMFIVLALAFLYITYYFQLYEGTKISRLFLICEIGYRAISSIFVVMDNQLTSYVDLLHYIPLLCSIILCFTTGLVAKIIFGILSSLICVIVVNHIYMIFF